MLESGCARFVLRRPNARNALNLAAWRAITGFCSEFGTDSSLKALVVEGDGPDFCAGADITEFENVYRDRESTRDYFDAMERALTDLAEFRRPTIAKLHGATMGGGLALALSCDLRFAAANARFSIPPAKLGLLYGPFETSRLIGLIGPARAKDMIFTARVVGAEEALRWGLVDRVVEPAALAPAVDATLAAMALLSQSTIRASKAIIEGLAPGDGVWRAVTMAKAIEAAGSADAREGREAFLDKRQPRFG